MQQFRWLLLFLCFGAATAGAQEDMVQTKQTARIKGRVLSYTAQVGRVPVRAMDSDEPHAYMSYTAYRMPSANGSPRPIMFAWGGGPSAPAISIHMTYGPKRVEQGQLIDNQNTLLTVTDLVFIDPVGTGFSRPTRPEYGKEFYGTAGDGASFAEFIRAFRAKYDPQGTAPVFLRGGSYGVWRASLVLELLERQGIRVAGVSTRSGGIQLGLDALPQPVMQALKTPARAASALHHGKLPPELGTTIESAIQNALKWSMDVYAPALARVASLTDAEREAVARDLSRYTGYPLAKINRTTLVITPREYVNDGLIPGQVLSNFDMREISGPAAPAGGRGGRAGGGGRGGGAGRGPQQPPPVRFNADNERTATYFRSDLGYRTDLVYLGGFEPGKGYMPAPGPAYRAPGSQWSYNTGPLATAQPGSPEYEEAMAIMQRGEGPPGEEPWQARALEINRKIRINVHSGLYDALNPCHEHDESIRRHPQYAQNFKHTCFRSGHSLQLDPRVAVLAGDDLRAWIPAVAAGR